MTNVKTTTKVIGLLFVGAMYREITEELIRWKNLKRRKPLLVTGVRQCGKTYVLKELGEKHFENTCYIFDDLGMERSSEFGLETVFRVINVRYESGMSTIITTNLSLQELKFPPNLAHKRIYDEYWRCVYRSNLQDQMFVR